MYSKHYTSKILSVCYLILGANLTLYAMKTEWPLFPFARDPVVYFCSDPAKNDSIFIQKSKPSHLSYDIINVNIAGHRPVFYLLNQNCFIEKIVRDNENYIIKELDENGCANLYVFKKDRTFSRPIKAGKQPIIRGINKNNQLLFLSQSENGDNAFFFRKAPLNYQSQCTPSAVDTFDAYCEFNNTSNDTQTTIPFREIYSLSPEYSKIIIQFWPCKLNANTQCVKFSYSKDTLLSTGLAEYFALSKNVHLYSELHQQKQISIVAAIVYALNAIKDIDGNEKTLRNFMQTLINAATIKIDKDEVKRDDVVINTITGTIEFDSVLSGDNIFSRDLFEQKSNQIIQDVLDATRTNFGSDIDIDDKERPENSTKLYSSAVQKITIPNYHTNVLKDLKNQRYIMVRPIKNSESPFLLYDLIAKTCYQNTISSIDGSLCLINESKPDISNNPINWMFPSRLVGYHLYHTASTSDQPQLKVVFQRDYCFWKRIASSIHFFVSNMFSFILSMLQKKKDTIEQQLPTNLNKKN